MNRLPPLVVFTALAVLVALPVLRDPAHRTFPSVSADNFADFWNLWWFSRCLREGGDLLFTPLLYFPRGTTLAFTDFGPLYGALAAPLLAIWRSPFAGVLAHNLIVVGTFVATGLATHAFARRFSASAAGALFAGFAAAFWAFRFHHVETVNLLSGYWIPAVALLTGSWWGLFPRGKRAEPERAGPPRDAARVEATNGMGAVADVPLARARRASAPLVALALCGFCAGATSAFVLSMAALFLIAWGGWSAAFAPRGGRARAARRGAIAVTALLLGAAPFLAPWFGLAEAEPVPRASPDELNRWGLDLAGLVLPERSLLLGPLARPAGARLHGPGGDEVFLGLALLIAAGIGIGTLRRRALPLALTAATGFALCLGTGFWIAGMHVDFAWSPFAALARAIPAFAALRTPERFLLITAAALAPLAAAGIGRLTRTAGGRRGAAAFALLAVAECWPRPMVPETVTVPAVMEAIARDPDPGAVVELSAYPQWNRALFHQTVHGKPLVSGPLTRPSRDARAFTEERRMFLRLYRPETAPGAMDELRAAGVTFLVWHKARLDGEALATVRAAYGGHAALFHEDERTMAFRMR